MLFTGKASVSVEVLAEVIPLGLQEEEQNVLVE